MKTLKVWSNNLIFRHLSQTMSDYCFLRSLFSFKKRKKHENMVKELIYSWVRSNWPILRPLSRFKKTCKLWKNSKYGTRTHFLSFSKAHYGHLAVFLKKEEDFSCSLKMQRSSIVEGKPVNRRSWTVQKEKDRRS